MDRIQVIYHDETPHGWWAESPDVKGWSAAADSYAEIRQLAEDGVRFALERNDVVIEHLVPTRA
jgi:predicted RNase H-like HicB family nuclease